MSLGAVGPEDAAECLESLQAIADADLADRWLRWHERHPDAALRALRSPTPVVAVEGYSRDWPAMPLRAYWSTVYAPWRSTARPAGWKGERSHWTRILRDLGRVRLRDIDAHVVADYLDGLRVERKSSRRHGQPMAGNTKRLHRAAVRALLLRAFRLRHLDSVPDLAIFPISGSTRRVRTPVPLEREQALALLASAPTVMHRALFAMQIGNGLRPSEAVRMRWEDIAWSSPATLAVRGTKTASSRAVLPITPLSGRHLRSWWRVAGEPEIGAVFVGRGGEAYRTAVGWKRSLTTAARRAGIERSISPYVLRHTFATLARDLGVDRDTCRRILRHTDDRMLREVYEQPSPTQLSARVQGFDLENS